MRWMPLLAAWLAIGCSMALLRAWRRSWSRGLGRRTRAWVGCSGTLTALVLGIVVGPLAARSAAPQARQVVFVLVGCAAGVAWLFFANILLEAVGSRRRD
jgi:protein-S-isoprenylcysteine O-methyltransferase Ste14